MHDATLNIDGDGQGDMAGWRRAAGDLRLPDGLFPLLGSATGPKQLHVRAVRREFHSLSDDDVCIGDRYRIGSALFEVTQPRVTCYRVGIRMDEPQMGCLTCINHVSLGVPELSILAQLPRILQ
jgi:hypothetical protein